MTLRPSRVAAVAIIAGVVMLLTNCSSVAYSLFNAPAYFGSFERHANLAYGTKPRQSLDVYVPSGAVHRPVVVFWYGGMWLTGSKEQYRFVGAALANSGYVAVLPDYRLFPQVRFPEFIEDGAEAVRWTRAHAAGFGGDPDALFLMGHSAGAHLAASLALDPRYLRKVGGDATWLRGWIGLSGPYALHAFERDIPLLHAIFRQPYSAADWRPIALVSPQAPPTLLLHGMNDTLVLPRETLELDQELIAAGVPVECHLYEKAGHTDTVAALSLPFRFEAPALADVRGFIERQVKIPVADRIIVHHNE
jgi:acetyl esterase/lipase